MGSSEVIQSEFEDYLGLLLSSDAKKSKTKKKERAVRGVA